MPAYNPKKMYVGQPGTTNTTLYTVPANTQGIIKYIKICNTTTNDATITLSLVPSGGSAGSTNRLINADTLRANETKAIDTGEVLNAGDFISALQGTSGAITLHISGIEVT